MLYLADKIVVKLLTSHVALTGRLPPKGLHSKTVSRMRSLLETAYRASDHMAREKFNSYFIGEVPQKHADLDRIYDLEGNIVPASSSSLIASNY